MLPSSALIILASIFGNLGALSANLVLDLVEVTAGRSEQDSSIKGSLPSLKEEVGFYFSPSSLMFQI